MLVKSRLLHSSLTKIITLLFIFGIFIPFIIGTTLIYLFSYNTIKSQLYSSSIKELETFSNYIDYKLSELNYSLFRISNHVNTLDFLNDYTSASDVEQFELERNLISYLNNQSLIIPKLSGIYVFDNYGNFVYSPGRMDVSAYNIFDDPILNNTNPDQREPVILGIHKQLNVSRNPDTVFSVGIYVRDFFTQELLGFILLDLKSEFLVSSLSYIYPEYPKIINYLILDDNDNVALSTGDFSIDLLPEKALQTLFDNSSGFVIIEHNGAKHFMFFTTTGYTNWKYIKIIPQNMVFENFISLYISFFLFLLFPIIALLFSYVYIYHKIVKPIEHLSDGMYQLELGNYGTTVSLKATTDIQVLIQGFNNMSIHLDHLVNRVFISELLQKDAELKALQSQIQPHFFSNILESLRGMAISHKNYNLAGSIKSLSKYMRYTIFTVRNIVTLQEEVTHIRDYIEIQNISYRNPVCCDVSLDITTETLEVPKMILQPLVENSLFYGNPGQTIDSFRISITTLKQLNSIKIFISDNGVGMEQHAIDTLNESIETSSLKDENNLHGIGLYNVNSRIKLFFGSYSTLFYESNISGGITVTLTLHKEALRNDKSDTL